MLVGVRLSQKDELVIGYVFADRKLSSAVIKNGKILGCKNVAVTRDGPATHPGGNCNTVRATEIEITSGIVSQIDR